MSLSVPTVTCTGISTEDADVEHGHVDIVEDAMSWGIGFDIHITPCVKQIACVNLRYSPGSSAQCPVMTETGGIWGGEWKGDPRGRGCMYAYSSFTSLYSSIKQ